MELINSRGFLLAFRRRGVGRLDFKLGGSEKVAKRDLVKSEFSKNQIENFPFL